MAVKFTGLTALALIALGSFVNGLLVPADKGPSKKLCADGVTRVSDLQCCSWAAIRDALIADVFEGVCGEAAHSTVRIAFHDAIGFSKTKNFGGGADGSMIAFSDIELANAATSATSSPSRTRMEFLTVTAG
ncbi:hypothetical protein EXIGLDRAFT_697747 [Exidia glandulosa HHB12029]|uniref:Plant heme peroxidase family profile domain-containing protein n=1 Tax=Exidia glandulosa HHB12029 TaxID=1314781 RepID=A0A165EM58_EXIGL|nr:hypothetical protein EXIGLDRAFT_697747 [Exidia glandulosa HHB12029]